MTSTLRFAVTLSSACLLVACGGIPKRTFEVRTIDPEERPVACLVVVDQDWEAAAAQQQVTNFGSNETLKIPVLFDRAEVDVTVVPVQLHPDDSSKILKIPRTRNEAFGHQSEARFLRADDPEQQLFILPKR